MLFILLIPAALDVHLRAHGRQPPPGLGAVRGDGGDDGRRGSGSTTRPSRTARRRRRRPGSRLAAGDGSTGGNLEGKEQRNGIVAWTEWATVTTDASNGSVNSAHDAYTGIGGAVPLVNMMTGEVIFGGVGSGLYGMLLFVDPDRLHRRADGRSNARVPRQEDRGAGGEAGLIGTIAVPMLVLVVTAGARWRPKYGDPSIYNKLSPQGFSETLYAYTSQAQQQRLRVRRLHRLRPAQRARQRRGVRHHLRRRRSAGSRCSSVASCRLLAALAVAGSLAAKRVAPVGAGHLPHRHPDVRRALDRRRDHRRRPHLLPRPAPRPGRPGPDREAVLRCRRET